MRKYLVEERNKSFSIRNLETGKIVSYNNKEAIDYFGLKKSNEILELYYGEEPVDFLKSFVETLDFDETLTHCQESESKTYKEKNKDLEIGVKEFISNNFTSCDSIEYVKEGKTIFNKEFKDKFKLNGRIKILVVNRLTNFVFGGVIGFGVSSALIPGYLVESLGGLLNLSLLIAPLIGFLLNTNVPVMIDDGKNIRIFAKLTFFVFNFEARSFENHESFHALQSLAFKEEYGENFRLDFLKEHLKIEAFTPKSEKHFDEAFYNEYTKLFKKCFTQKEKYELSTAELVEIDKHRKELKELLINNGEFGLVKKILYFI